MISNSGNDRQFLAAVQTIADESRKQTKIAAHMAHLEARKIRFGDDALLDDTPFNCGQQHCPACALDRKEMGKE